jgi:hypothetical protein
MKKNRLEDVTPRPGELVESLRDFGYTLHTAIADLVDNSITAHASNITISVAAKGRRPAHIAIIDDGLGMSVDTLVEAMRLGTSGPQARRTADDLGRFGLGMKTASLSQGRAVSVITKRLGEEPNSRCLDVGFISSEKSWSLKAPDSPLAIEYSAIVGAQSSGTAVIVEDLDRATFLQVPPEQLHEHLGMALRILADHLALVFHRFITDGLKIRIGEKMISAWDPFLPGKSTALPVETLRLAGEPIVMSPYVLPHKSKLSSEDEHARAGGPHGWNDHQGFYIYRCDRLIVPGTWLNLGLKKEEHYKLARIAVDLPNSMDEAWHLNVTKAHVAAPAYLRDDLRRIARKTRSDASNVFRYRGERVAPTQGPPERFVWKREETHSGVRFRIDRTHPAIRAVLHVGCEHEDLLQAAFELVERTVPVAAMLQDPGSAVDGSVEEPSAELLDHMVSLADHTQAFLIRTGKSPEQARSIVLSSEPFVRWRAALVPLLGVDPNNPDT